MSRRLAHQKTVPSLLIIGAKAKAKPSEIDIDPLTGFNGKGASPSDFG